MKIKNIIGGLLMAGLFLQAACKVDPELTSVYEESVGWTSEANLELSLNKFYPLIGQSYYEPHITQDAFSDILKMNIPNANPNLFVLGSSLITPGSNPLGNWDNAYTWVRNCNEFLDGLRKNGNKLPEATTKRAEAEVRFFRAHVYFELAKRYGASVILLKDLPTEAYHARSAPDEVWNFIAEDLDYAALHLPPTVEASRRGKLTKGAAFGLKARAMLYAKRWKASSDAVLELEKLGLYDLFPNYEQLFNQKRSSPVENKESILEFGYKSPDFGYSFDYFYAPPGDRGYAQVSPTENLVSAYEMADGTKFDWKNPAHAANPYVNREPRFYASILFNGASWKGRTVETFVGGADGYAIGGGTTSTGYYMKKFLDGSIKTQTEGFRAGELTFYFMRYAEVLLIYAEAMAEQNNLEEALRALNKVRARAGFTNLLTAGSKDDFMKLLVHERMVELAFEGHRFWDLRRWGMAPTVLNGTNVTGTKITRNANGTFTYEQVDADNGKKRIYPARYNRFPIPASEIQRNPLIEQFDEWK
ncbi:RagB/SusD family nutrient uptake outer membrane protein [Desertivirga brevis]|uniref:RagB/SusD family nutrient uptake outer membrane protein n=1 Tax=Desertivirga brevis TaxID=2810310 RepID=UPI001A968CA2|nr:RagB/SusD family nutrient uptake outer membrane protein [Pedobacter sp. SYSU D00873]